MQYASNNQWQFLHIVDDSNKMTSCERPEHGKHLFRYYWSPLFIITVHASLCNEEWKIYGIKQQQSNITQDLVFVRPKIYHDVIEDFQT
jgi:hypothetical protein